MKGKDEVWVRMQGGGESEKGDEEGNDTEALKRSTVRVEERKKSLHIWSK